MIRSLAGLLARRGVARPGRLLLRGRARGLGRLVTLILAVAIHLLLGLLLGIGGLIRVLRAVLLGLIFAASQLLLGLLLLVGRLLRVATVLPVLLLRRARGRALAAGLGGLILTLPGEAAPAPVCCAPTASAPRRAASPWLRLFARTERALSCDQPRQGDPFPLSAPPATGRREFAREGFPRDFGKRPATAQSLHRRR